MKRAVWMAALAVFAGNFAQSETLTLGNGKVELSYDGASHRLTIKSGNHIAMAVPCHAVTVAETSQEVRNSILEVKSAAGSQDFWLDGSFVLTRTTLNNTGTAPLVLDKLITFSVNTDPDKPLNSTASAKVVSLGADGPTLLKNGKVSYAFLANVDPATRSGVVSGWVTHERSSGIVLSRLETIAQTVNNSRLESAMPKIESRAEFGRLIIPPGKSEVGETFAIGFFDDARDGLEELSDEIAKVNNIHLPKPMCGYSTWYHAHALDQKRMAELAQFSKDQHLKDFGFEFLQIDDQWQASSRDFTDHNPKGPYPDGMKKTADAIHSANLTAGLWLTPFGWDSDAPSLKDHHDWFVHKETTGDVYSVHWAGDALDMSNPGAREFLAGVITRITHEWGYKLLKLDGLWTGMAMTQLYPDPTYRDDSLGDAVFFDPSKTNEQVFRDGLRLVRKAAGDDVFLLGCTVAQNMRSVGGSFGLVDAMRIGPDIAARWDNVVRCAKPASQMYFLNGRVWWNDPDCLMLRNPLTLEEGRAWGSFIAISGQLNLVSEWLPGLPPEKLDVLKRTIPNVPHRARPIDLFDRELPRQWHMSYGEGQARRDVVALFNWTPPTKASNAVLPGAPMDSAGNRGQVAPEPPVVKVDLPSLGLSDGEYLAFDFWGNQFLDPISASKEFDVPPGSCRVIALVKKVDHPQLISTSRHVTQGLVDVEKVNWDDAGKTLSGTSRVVIDDPYELRISSNGMKLGTATLTGNADATITGSQDGSNVRVMIKPTATGEINWRVQFEEK